MPCDQVLQNSVLFSAGTDPELMKGALEDAGYEYYVLRAGGISFNHRDDYQMSGTFIDGVFQVTEGTDTDAIKRAYSVRSVKATAKKMGWTVKQDSKNPLKMTVSRRA